ncbi:SPOR domain-containing protein [Longibacter sp.]|uniref:SPOR domain-containing protein n=1 Tax=Longibacter sp. TaxID=2045415 RepID=UPI003EBAD547
MSASIFERVADELGLPPDRSEKLVRAMIREIRKRAHKGRGVKIPNLGAFSVEDGTLTFTPRPSVARAVNQRFEGLSEERVALPEVEETSGKGEGPTTITRGFDMGAWDPLDTGSGAASSGASERGRPESGEADAPSSPADTDEFEIPTDGPDTDEFEAPVDEPDESANEPAAAAPAGEPAAEASTEASDPDSWNVGAARPLSDEPSDEDEVPASPARLRDDDDVPQAEDDIDAAAPPSVDDHRSAEAEPDPYEPSGFSASDTEDESQAATGDEEEEPNIWASDSAWDFSTVTSKDVDGTDDEERETEASDQEEDDLPSYRPPDADEQEAENQPSRSIFDFDEEEKEKREPPKTTKIEAAEFEQESDKEESEGSRTVTVLSITVILLLALAGGWIVLGQQGIVPSPGRVLGFEAGVTTAQNTQAQTERTDPDATSGAATPSPAGSDASSDGSADQPQASETTPAAGETSGSSGFDRAAGGFTIAVASRPSQSGAEAMVDQFRRNLSDTDYPVDIVSATADGTTRYRVGVGQFSTRAEANRVRGELQNRLPDGAWPVPIE